MVSICAADKVPQATSAASSEASASAAAERRSAAPFVALAIIAASMISVISGLGYRALAESMETEALNNVRAIAELKARDVGLWLETRQSRAVELARDEATRRFALRLISPDSEPDEAAFELRREGGLLGFADVDILDGSARSMLHGAAVQAPEIVAATRVSLKTGAAVLVDLHIDARTGTARFGFVAPVPPSAGTDAGAAALVYAEFGADDYLYPFVRSWPLSSATGYGVLARRDGEDVLYLSAPPGDANAALRMRLPFATSDVPIGNYLRSQTDAARRVTPDGTHVFSAGLVVPGTDWLLVASIGEDEALAGLHSQIWTMAERALVGIASVFIGFSFIWRRRRLQKLSADLARSKVGSKAENRFLHTFEQAAFGIVHAGMDGHILRVNQRLCDMIGFSREELLNMSVSDLQHPDDRLETRKHFEKARAGEIQAYLTEQRYRAKDGGFIHVCVSVALVRGEGDEPDYCIGVIEDITRRRTAENALRESEERFRLAMMGANDGLWDLRLDEQLAVEEIYFSSRYKAMLGYADDELENDIAIFSRLTSPETYQAARAQLIEIGSGAKASFDLEMKMRHKDGRWLDILSRGFPVYDDRSQMVRLVGTHVDITERKRHETASRLAGAVFTSTHEGVVVTDPSGLIITVNPAFSTITGYEVDELGGRHMRILQSGQHGRDFYQAMWSTVHAGGYWQGEIWNRRKCGEVYPQWLTISAVLDENGATSNYVGVFTDISILKHSEKRLEFLAHHDPLTGLPNRLLLRSRIEHAIARASRIKTNCAVLFIDLDRFKKVNDSLGHPAGDQLLILVADRIKKCMRASDTLAREGGDEFIACIEDVENAKDVEVFAQRLIGEMAQPFMLAGAHEVFIGISMGAALFPADGDTPNALIQHADSALYGSKKSGGAAVQLYSSILTSEANERLQLETRLRRALERSEFVLQYQPLVALSDERIVGVESLVRWRSPAGLIPPMKFIPFAEETGLIIQLGEWVLREACSRMKAWRDAGLHIDMIAVNVSPRQFDRADLCERVGDILAETGLPAECLELEITESALMQQGAGAEEKLKILKALGVRVAIDDFGTGHSSLAYLKRFPIDKLKIDSSFIADIPGDPTSMEITSTIIRLAHSLNVTALTEGVETRAQADFLALCGCDLAQGYLFDRPLWEEELIERLDSAWRTERLHG